MWFVVTEGNDGRPLKAQELEGNGYCSLLREDRQFVTKKPEVAYFGLPYDEPTTGLEPVTCSLRVSCSTS